MPLLSVLWGVALLLLITTSILNSTTIFKSIAVNAMSASEADAIAEACIVRAVVGIFDTRPDRRWLSGRYEQFYFNEVRARIFVQDEMGRIDLNVADEGLLKGLLRSKDFDPVAVDLLTQAIVSWRSPRPRSSEVDTIQLRTHQVKPRRGPFQSVDELMLVPGMTADIYRRVFPALTVYSQQPNVDPQLAPSEVLLALPGMSPSQAAAIVSQRDQRNVSSPLTVNNLVGRAFAISIQLSQSTVKRNYEAVIRFSGEAEKPFWTLNWAETSSRSEDP